MPQIMILALLFMGIGFNLANDGKPIEGKHSFWKSVFRAIVWAALLYWGGFFG